MISNFKLIAIALFCMFFYSCKSEYSYSKFITIDKDGWSYADTLSYEIPIDTAVQNYELYISVRYSEDYQFNNLWLKFVSDSIIERVDVPLFDKTGLALGKCSGSICTQTILWKDLHATTANYTTRVIQNMRKNPLENISELGLLIKKKESL